MARTKLDPELHTELSNLSSAINRLRKIQNILTAKDRFRGPNVQLIDDKATQDAFSGVLRELLSNSDRMAKGTSKAREELRSRYRSDNDATLAIDRSRNTVGAVL